jgi:hypothetical protein
VAKRVEEITLGVDVCKDKLDVHTWETGEACQVVNGKREIRDFLRGLHGALRLAAELLVDGETGLAWLAGVGHGYAPFRSNCSTWYSRCGRTMI